MFPQRPGTEGLWDERQWGNESVKMKTLYVSLTDELATKINRMVDEKGSATNQHISDLSKGGAQPELLTVL